MPAAFREITPAAGVDEQTPSGGAGIVVPWKGSNVVLLEGGAGLNVASNHRPAVEVDPITDPQQFMALVIQHDLFSLYDTTGLSWALAMLKAGTYRFFKVTGNAVPGLDVARVQATNPRTSRVEAMLKVLVVRPKTVKIALRPVQVLDDRGNPALMMKTRFEPQLLRDQMNAIWTPQANVAFQLTSTDAVVIDGLPPGADRADIQNPTTRPGFLSKKDKAAHVTAFFVRWAINGATGACLGVTDPEAGFMLIGDDRSESTLAHEGGHFLGSLNENGTFSQVYDHPGGQDPVLLMRDGGAGRKIPYGAVTDFNKGYRRG
jgi:hypothetical protein